MHTKSHITKKQSNKVADAICSVVNRICCKKPVSLHEPSISELEEQIVKDCTKSTFVSSVGKYVDRFENEIAEYTGAKHAIAVVNGTAALHISLILAGVKKDSEVLVPGLTFVATANAVCYIGAVPHFVDSEDESLGICPIKLDTYLSATCDIQNDVCVNKKNGVAKLPQLSLYIYLVIHVKLKRFLKLQKNIILRWLRMLQNHLAVFIKANILELLGNSEP